ncbi:MAG: HAMP domain-containing histidine kinase [Myxococcales bacterium]|nr:HAMP domain-containing histidine kinase [Myxococcales bacterium]
MTGFTQQIPLRLAAVAVGLVLTWAVGIPALLSLDDIAASSARQFGALGAGLAGFATFMLARWRLRTGVRASFGQRTAVDMALTTQVSACIVWWLGTRDPRLPGLEAFSLLCLHVATGLAGALIVFALIQGPLRALGPRDREGLPGIRTVFVLSAVALGVFAAVTLGVGSAGRAAGLREQAEAQRLLPLARLLATGLGQARTAQERARLVDLLNADIQIRAELRPPDRPPALVAEAAPRWAESAAGDGLHLLAVGGARHHVVRQSVGDQVLWITAPAGVRPPVLASVDLPNMLILGLLLLGVPLAALGVGHGARTALDDLTRTLLSMSPGAPTRRAALGVPVRDDDEVGDLAQALNRLCRQHDRQSSRLANDLDAAEEDENTRNRFLAVASHALKLPLQRIDDHCRVLGRAGPLNAAQVEDVEAIVGATDQLKSHVEEILSLSRLEAGRENPLNIGTVSIGELARAVVAASRMNAAPGVTLGLSVDPLTPAIEADGPRVRQVLENLVGNALKFTTDGFVEVAVGPTWGGGVHIQVSDSGPGIPQNELTRIFQEFHRVDAHRQVAGTGLGLAISRRLVERHGGSLWAESVQGEGSIFHLRLPRRTPERGPRSTRPPEAT